MGLLALVLGYAAGRMWPSASVDRRQVGTAPADQGTAGDPDRRPAAAADRQSTSREPSADAPTYGFGGGARVALVFDDLGRRVDQIVALESLAVPLTYAVLPFEPRTDQVVRELHLRGAEVLCHLPMEGGADSDPGPGALRRDMGRGELARTTGAALERVPGAVGVNNHMGSGFSEDPQSMGIVLEVIARQGLFFLDSRTSAESVGYRRALELGVPAAQRQVFLDRDPEEEAIRQEFIRLLEIARARGAAIAIGHPRDSTLSVLREELPRALAAGFEFVPVSYLLDRPGSLPR